MTKNPLAIGSPVRRLVVAARREGVTGLLTTLRHGVEWRRRRWHTWRGTHHLDRHRSRGRTASTFSLAPAPGPRSVVPRVSVIVTSHNREDLLPVALRSVQLQNFKDFECVVVDDGSSDNSAAVAQTFADVDGRFRVVVHAVSRGSSAARNTGVAVADSDLICFLDDDDFLLDGSLTARVQRLEGAPSHVAGSFCDWINTDPEVGLELFFQRFDAKRRGTITYSRLRSGTPFIMTSPLIRRSAIELVDGFSEDVHIAEDADFWFRLCRRGFTFVDAEHTGVAYRRSPRSKVLQDPAQQLRAMQSVFDAADRPQLDASLVGPMPVREAMPELASAADRSAQLYRYLALMALDDVGLAVSTGSALMPAAVRAEIEPGELTRSLIGHAVGRRSLIHPDERFEAARAIHQLVAGLMPPYTDRWELRQSIEDLRHQRRARAELLRPTPQVVRASDVSLDGSIVLVAEALYHVDELGPLHRELVDRGYAVHFMLSPKTVSAAHSALGRYVDSVVAYDDSVAERARAIVVLNDWGPTKEMLLRANENGVPTFAKVEGVQDFNDDDTGRHRHAYRTAATILGQGPNDVAALPDKRVEIVGSTRLERIWNEEPVDRTDFVLVNLNFTFNVLTEHRDDWMRSVREAVRISGLPAGVSVHPAERSMSVGLDFVERSFRHEITGAGVLVSRFSTVPFEAMARGVPFIYHNPHGEQVPTFKTPNGAFPITYDQSDLARSLREAVDQDDVRRARWERFFCAQIDIDPDRTSESRAAEVIEKFI